MEGLIMAAQLILGLSILVGLHELGHMLAARAFGMRVEQYFIGFPPKLFSIKRGETEYGIGAIPLGGFVKISGMVDESLDTKALKEEPKPWEFRAKPAWQRLIVMLGGIIVNVLVGILIFVGMTYKNGNSYLATKDVKYGIVANELGQEIGLRTGDRIVKVNGKPFANFSDAVSMDVFLGQNSYYTIERNGTQEDVYVPNNFLNKLTDKKNAGKFIEPVQPFEVGGIAQGLPAEKAGVVTGDRITAVNGQPTAFYHEFQQAIKDNAGKKVTLAVQRKSQQLTLTSGVTPDGLIGVKVKGLLPITHEDYTLGQAIPIGTNRAFGVIGDNIKGFSKIFQGQVSASKALSGPIGIAQIFGGTWDWDRFWAVCGLLSMALAFTNLLPIPALDGGHSVILLYEIVSGRKPSDRFLETAQRVGMVLLLGIMAFAIFNDVFKVMF